MLNIPAEVKPGTVFVMGIPFDANSSYFNGAAKAPHVIRMAFHDQSSSYCTESGFDLEHDAHFIDIGDIHWLSNENLFGEIEKQIAALIGQHCSVISIGGDHSITYPIIKAYGKQYGNLNILQLDAHPDMYHEFNGQRLSHACPFARIMEEGLVARLVQVGIRNSNPHQRLQAEKYGVEVVTMDNWIKKPDLDFTGPVYISLDLDVLDPAFMPAVSHPEPGGLSTRDAIGIIHALKVPIVGADIVEYNPLRDANGLSAFVAAKCLKEIAAGILASS